MAGFAKRKRRLSNRSSATTSVSRQSTPLVSLQRPSLASQHQTQRRRVTAASQLRLLRHDTAPIPRRLMSVEEEDYTDESLDHIIMAIDMKERGTVGCAYYVAREERLFCMEDIVDGGMDIVDALKIDIQPTLILLSPRVDTTTETPDQLQNARHVSMVDDGEGALPPPYQTEFRPSQEFSYESAKSKLVKLSSLQAVGPVVRFLVPGESSTFEEGQDHDDFGSTSRKGKLLRLSRWMDLENTISVGCVGAVISCLQRKRANDYLPDDPEAQRAYRVNEVEMFSLSGTMLINSNTLASLQIIQPESHPNTFNQGPGTAGSKESLSIYGLFHHLARTPQGRARLRQYFLRACLDLDEVNRRLDFISVFARPDNLILVQRLSKSMSKVKNMRLTMTLLRKGINSGNKKFGGLKSGVWASLLEFAYHTIDIRDTLREVLGGDNLPLWVRTMETLDHIQLQRVGKMVHDVVDLDSSVDQHRTVVKRGINDRLDEIKNVYDGMDHLLSQAANDIARDIPPHLDVHLNVIYFPQLGFHITVPVDEMTGQPVYNGGDVPWEMMFTTKNQVYFKDARMHEMDEQLGDLYAMICDIEIEISYELAQRVIQDEKMLIAASEICGELDSLLALTQGASQYKLTRPRMTEDNVVVIKGGRHLLQEMTVPSYVPNDAFLMGGKGLERDPSSSTVESDLTANSWSDVDGPSMLLLTGPNYSGKSVYQKQVALAVYLAHIGSFVPAQSAVIGLTDKILTRITTRETVSKIQSAFTIDLQQIALTLHQATRRSLVVIDEFGKGTDSCDGAGLACGVFQYLLNLHPKSPKVLAATHFHEIFEHGFLKPQPNLEFAHMEVRVDRRGEKHDGDLASEVTYLYNLKQGRSNLSYGAQCAAMNGIPSAIIRRANVLSTLIVQGEDLVAACAGIGQEEEEDLEDAESCARAFLSCGFDGRVMSELSAAESAGEEDPRSMLESILGRSWTGSVS